MDYEKNIPADQFKNVNGSGSGMLGFRCRDCGCEW